MNDLDFGDVIGEGYKGTFTCDQFPVQAEGKIGVLPFYFRARHGEWALAVPLIETGDPVDVLVNGGDGTVIEGGYDDAEYLSLDAARSIIDGAVNSYREALP